MATLHILHFSMCLVTQNNTLMTQNDTVMIHGMIMTTNMLQHCDCVILSFSVFSVCPLVQTVLYRHLWHYHAYEHAGFHNRNGPIVPGSSFHFRDFRID